MVSALRDSIDYLHLVQNQPSCMPRQTIMSREAMLILPIYQVTIIYLAPCYHYNTILQQFLACCMGGCVLCAGPLCGIFGGTINLGED
jgi:hypothetical protein